jgi:hypothetical protein
VLPWVAAVPAAVDTWLVRRALAHRPVEARLSPAYQIAEVHAARGEANPAFEWLERAYAQRDSGIAWSKVDPHLRSLRTDPRWEVFLRKMGLAD